jgi:hypothetical protein
VGVPGGQMGCGCHRWLYIFFMAMGMRIMNWGQNFLYIWGHFNGILHKSLSSVILVVQPFKFFRQNHNIAQTLEPVIMKLGMFTIPSEVFVNPSCQQYQHCILAYKAALILHSSSPSHGGPCFHWWVSGNNFTTLNCFNTCTIQVLCKLSLYYYFIDLLMHA